MIVAGGGTGGHLFPGIAIAQEFLAKEPETQALFVSTGNPMEKKALAAAGFELRTIPAAGLKGKGLGQKIKAFFKLPIGILKSISIMLSFRPNIVIGVGGYSSGPVVLAAWLTCRKTVLHEQNILPGITNKILSRFVKKVFVSFANTSKGLSERKMILTGNPVRKEILEYSGDEAKKLKGLTVLVIGGSQGAKAINKAVCGSLASLEEKKDYYFIHQTGANEVEAVREEYKKNGVEGRVEEFFTDMAPLYKKCDLMICRAGATTVAEVTALGKGVIFIPFPYAADNHQVLNAKTMEDRGAAEMIEERDLTDELLAGRLNYFSRNRDALKKMEEQSMLMGKPDAGEMIVNESMKLLKRSN